MKIRKHIKKILVIGTLGLIAGGVLIGCTQTGLQTGFTQEQLNQAKSDEYNRGVTSGKASVDITSDNAQIRQNAFDTGYLSGKASVDITSDNDDAVFEVGKEKQAEIDRLNKVIEDLQTAEAEVDIEDKEGYNIDELNIGAEFNATISDRQLSGLFDGKITFDEDEYDAEEVVYLTNLKIANNEEDEYKADTFLQVPENGIKYIFEIDNELNTSLITEDETLKFDLMGNEAEVTEWNNDKVTFTTGIEKTLNEDDSITINGKTITLKMVADGYVHIDVDGVTKKIYEDDTERVNGIEIKATEIGESTSWRKGIATLKIGEDVTFDIENGDEYEADDRWEWTVTSNSIGLKLVESFLYVEEDEENKALAVGEKLSLPNGYVSVSYDGLVIEDTAKYNFDINGNFVKGKGDFVNGIKSYDKIYIDATGIYDDNDVNDAELNVTSIKLGDTDLTLDTNSTHLIIDDIDLNLDLTELKVSGDNICGEEEDYRTNYGVIISNPENGCEDNEFSFVIPEEELTASITVRYKQ